MAGDTDALRAIIQAGGFKTSSKRTSVVIIRRGPNGRAMLRTVDLLSGMTNGRTDLVPLRRFDVVYVPRQTWHLASFGGSEGLRSCRLAMNGFPYQAHMYEAD